MRPEAALAGSLRLCFHQVSRSDPTGTLGKSGGRGGVMTSIGDICATKNELGTTATKNGPLAISDALTAFESQAGKLPAEPTPDAKHCGRLRARLGRR